MSKQRDLILKVLRSSEGHMTAEEIYESAREEMPNISLGTVYRGLSALADGGEIMRISVANGKDYFDKTCKRHDHLICSVCGKVKDIYVPSLEKEMQMLSEGRLTGYTLNVLWTCPRCI